MKHFWTNLKQNNQVKTSLSQQSILSKDLTLKFIYYYLKMTFTQNHLYFTSPLKISYT